MEEARKASLVDSKVEEVKTEVDDDKEQTSKDFVLLLGGKIFRNICKFQASHHMKKVHTSSQLQQRVTSQTLSHSSLRRQSWTGTHRND